MKIYCGNKFHIRCYLVSLKELGEIEEDFIIFSARSNSFFQPIMAKLLGLSTARYWTGNDSWRYEHDWTYRIRAKFINLFIDKHYFLASHLIPKDFRSKNPFTYTIRILKTPLEYHFPIYRKNTDKVTIGFYDAQGTFENRYGQDILKKVQNILKDKVEWLIIKPGQYNDDEMVTNFYSKIDLYLRPTRWDGDPFMVREAIHFGIPTISTFSNCKENVKCYPQYDNAALDIAFKIEKLVKRHG